MEAWLDRKFFDKNKAGALVADIEASGDKEAYSYLFKDLKAEIDELEIHEDYIFVSLSNNLGSFNFRIPLGIQDFITMMELTIKRMNKIKTILEAMK